MKLTPEQLAGLLKRLGKFRGEDFTSSFENRLILQKAIYLLERGFHIDLNYRFNWYLRGPYSPELAADAYRLAPGFDAAKPVRFSDQEIEERFQRFARFIQPHLRDGEWMECAASLLWKAREMRVGIDDDPSGVIKAVIVRKPWLQPNYCRTVWNELKAWQAIPKAAVADAYS